MELMWKDVYGYEDLYEISNDLTVRRKDSGNILTPFKRKRTKKSNKLYVGLTKNGQTYTKNLDLLHKLSFNVETEIKNLKDELWMNIIGFEDVYQISNKGRVKSLDRYINQTHVDGNIYKRFIKGRILSIKRNNGNGYIMVQLSNGCDKYAEGNDYMHALVAKHFLSNPQNKPTVNHKDGDKSNNTVENLEWATESEQIRHALEIGLLIPCTKKLTEEQVRNIRKMHKYKNNKLTNKDICQEYNISSSNLYNIVSRKTWKHVI